MTWILNLFSIFLFVGSTDSHKSVASNFDFCLPKKHLLLVHYLVQPVREAQGVAGKLLTIIFQFPLIRGLLAVLLLLSSAAIVLALGVAGVMYILGYGSVSYPLAVAGAGASYLVAFFIPAFLGEGKIVIWERKPVTYANLQLSSFPAFVRARAAAVQTFVENQKGRVRYRLTYTEKDPILKAIITVNGKTEELYLAVFNYGSEEPLCE